MGRPKVYVNARGQQVAPDAVDAAVIYDLDDARIKDLHIDKKLVLGGDAVDPEADSDYPSKGSARGKASSGPQAK